MGTCTSKTIKEDTDTSIPPFNDILTSTNDTTSIELKNRNILNESLSPDTNILTRTSDINIGTQTEISYLSPYSISPTYRASINVSSPNIRPAQLPSFNPIATNNFVTSPSSTNLVKNHLRSASYTNLADTFKLSDVSNSTPNDGRKRSGTRTLRGMRNSIVADLVFVRSVQEQHKEYIAKKFSGALTNVNDSVIQLPRGGSYVLTSVFPIQFGMPPETVKDSLNLGLKLPTYYVVPIERFDLKSALNIAEFEFPAYFNFFVLRRKINLVTTPAVAELIKNIFQETLLGPKEYNICEDDYTPDYPIEMRANLISELNYFSTNPFNPSEKLNIDTILEFTYFVETDKLTSVATLDNGVKIELNELINCYTVYDVGGIEVANVPIDIFVTPPVKSTFSDIQVPQICPENIEALNKKRESQFFNRNRSSSDVISNKEFLSVPMPIESSMLNPYVFVPPLFGVTILGNSHGFDPKGTTTGFVVWMNRRGIMVDPPPFSSHLLKMLGIPQKLIVAVILTHCHADHDAGTFQQILEESRITVITTPTVMSSFLRKYSSISNLEPGFLNSLFVFRPVTIGEKVPICCGELEFFYSLHAIPCVGFVARCGGKSMVYSSDTLNDAKSIEKLFTNNHITAQRRDQLLSFPWHHDLILHEAGVPPIHTPISTFAELSDDIKSRLFLVHVAEKDVPSNLGLKIAKIGVENTIILIPYERPTELFPVSFPKELTNFNSFEILSLVTTLDIVSELPVVRSIEVLQYFHRRFYSAGATIFEGGSRGNELFIVAMGRAAVFSNEDKLLNMLAVCEIVGEAAVVLDKNRNATLRAVTDCEMLVCSKHDFLFLFRDTPLLEKLRHLGKMRTEPSWPIIALNSVLSKLSSLQRTSLQLIMHSVKFNKNDFVWKSGEILPCVIIIQSGKYSFTRATDLPPFTRGAFVGDIKALIDGTAVSDSLICLEAGLVYSITASDMLKFIACNPGLLMRLMNTRFVE